MGRIKQLSIILGVVLALSATSGVFMNMYGYYAKASVVMEIKQDLDKHKIKHRMEYLEERMWNLEAKWDDVFKEEYGRPHKTIEELVNFMPDEDKLKYRELEKEYEELEKELEEAEST